MLKYDDSELQPVFRADIVAKWIRDNDYRINDVIQTLLSQGISGIKSSDILKWIGKVVDPPLVVVVIFSLLIGVPLDALVRKEQFEIGAPPTDVDGESTDQQVAPVTRCVD